MGWKTMKTFGKSNLPDNASRLEALEDAAQYLRDLGVDNLTVKDVIGHEKNHLFAFPDYEVSSGKKLKLVLQKHPGEGIRLAVVPNRLHLREDVINSLDAVGIKSEGDQKFGCLDRFRKR
jgi:hypothetical protein